MREVRVTTWYLHMLRPDWLRPARPAPELTVVRAEVPCPELNRFLYTAVGAGWWWTDRLAWTYERWLAYLDRPQVETWVGYVSGTPAGYFELERGAPPAPGVPPELGPSLESESGAEPGHGQEGAGKGGDVELAYFGLLPRFVGRGLGGALLTAATAQAWALVGSAGRVWLHTCSLDSPRAIANYRARGFRLYHETTQRQTLPEQSPGPWPGADARP